MSNSFKKLPLFALTSSLMLAAGSGFANPISDAKECLQQAAKIADANVTSAGSILADAVKTKVLKASQHDLNGWNGLSSDAKGIYHSSLGWGYVGGVVKFHNIVYMGKGCGILSTSRLACQLQLGGDDLTIRSNLDHKLQQTVGMKCSVCRGAKYTTSGDRYGVPVAMRASALKSDLGIAKNFSVGTVKIVDFEDEKGGSCPSTPNISGAYLFEF